jgi:uncharacterized protein (TIGR02284 family)
MPYLALKTGKEFKEMSTKQSSEHLSSQSNTYPLSSVSKLHVTLVDAINGYNTMVAKAEPELQHAISPLAALHRRHAAELADILRENGISPDTDGSVMGRVHETVVNVRALFGDLDSDALPSVIRGEQSIVSAYQDALADIAAAHDAEPGHLHIPVTDRLNNHVLELQSLLHQVQAQSNT